MRRFKKLGLKLDKIILKKIKSKKGLVSKQDFNIFFASRNDQLKYPENQINPKPEQ